MRKSKLFFSVITIFIYFSSGAQTVRILFDATKGEMAGNADWVIDANLHNIGFDNGPAVAGQGFESNPQQIPSPPQSGIDTSTVETYWEGGISSWGIDCVNQHYQVETLPYNGIISYGNPGNVMDLSNYNVFIVCEPNIVFTADEKTALINFVQNGGGLFMISDHDNSDRNFDGWDSPHIWNDLMTNNSVLPDPFGMSFDYLDFSQTSTNISATSADSIINGPFGNVAEVQWSNGTSLTLNPSQNASVLGVIYKNGSSFGNNNVMCAYSRFGNGKVAAIGDSSPCDDGTGDPNDILYDGYIQDAAGNHRKLLMNITIWLATADVSTGMTNTSLTEKDFQIYPNPSTGNFYISADQKSPFEEINIFNSFGEKEEFKILSYGKSGGFEINASSLPPGIYFLEIMNKESRIVRKIVKE